MRGRDFAKNRRRSALALGLSALVHLVLAAWLVTHVPVPSRLPEVDRPPELDVEIGTVPAPEKTTVPSPPAAGGVAPAHRGTPKAGKTSKVAAGPEPEPAVSPQGAGSEPQRLDLRIPEVLLPHLAGDLDDLEGGHTYREDPRAHGRSNKEKAVEAERRIGGWLEDAEAEHRVQVGLVDPWFGDLKKRFEHDASEPSVVPQHVLGNVATVLAKSYVEGARQYGATGNPGGPSPGGSSILPFTGTGVNDQFPMPPIPRLTPTGNPGMFNELSLVTVVDLRQDPDGSLLSAEILVRSGDAAFDRYVLDIIPKSMELVRPPPDAGFGFHDKGSHTVWEFAGRLTFLRDVKDMKLARDGWYFVPAALLGGVSFDETTGYVGMMVTPYYKCQVRLLRVY